MKKKICVITSTRAEYGLLRNIIRKIDEDPVLECRLVVTGSHLVPEFGNTVMEIENDKNQIDARIEIQMAGDSSVSICKTMGMALISFGEYFDRTKPDLAIILGDRYEMCAIACAAINFRIPIAHIYGGETTEGAIDEAFRHAITKMSYLHFTSTEEYRKRVIQLGEAPERVYNVGSTGIENIKDINLLTKDELVETLGFNLRDNYAVGTYHPVTFNTKSIKEAYELMEACICIKDIDFLFTKANADAEGKTINGILTEYANRFGNIFLVDSLGYKRYLSALKHSMFVIGNSSSGIMEAPSLGIPTINIGNRQKGRTQAKSVINVPPNKQEIIESIKKARTTEFENVNNPYYGDDTSNRIVEVIKDNLVNKSINLSKPFYNIQF